MGAPLPAQSARSCCCELQLIHRRSTDSSGLLCGHSERPLQSAFRCMHVRAAYVFWRRVSKNLHGHRPDLRLLAARRRRG